MGIISGTRSESNVVTDFNMESGAAVAFVATTWVTIFSKNNITKLTKIKALTIDITAGIPTDPAFRIRACPTGAVKRIVFPYDAGVNNTFSDNVEITLSEMVQIPSEYDYDIQVYCTATGGASSALSELKIIEMGW